MARAFFLYETAHVLRLCFGEEARIRQWFGTDPTEFVAAAVDHGIAVGATAFGFGFDAAREHRCVVQIDLVKFKFL